MFSSRVTRTTGQTSSNRWPSHIHHLSTTLTPLLPPPSPTTRPPGRMGATERRVNCLPPSPLLRHSSHPRPLRSLPPPPTPALLLLLCHCLLLSPTHPPPPLSLSHPSHQCTTHQSICIPLRTPVRWPWGRGGACWRVRVELSLCSWMGEWCSPQPKNKPFFLFLAAFSRFVLRALQAAQ